MEIKGLYLAIIAAVTGLMGLFGWSHKGLRQRMDHMEMQNHKKPSFSDVRMIMADKIAPLQTEYQSLSRRIDDLRMENNKLNDKIDKLLVICTKLTHDK